MTTYTCIRLLLHIEGPWAVADPAAVTDAVDLPAGRNPLTKGPHLPGTSLIGALRRHLGEPLAEKWLGSPPGEREVRTGELSYTPSRLRLLGTSFAEQSVPLMRGRTAIEGQRGAARQHTLRRESVWPSSNVTIVFVHPGPQDEELTALLRIWAPDVGRGRSLGMGSARVRGLELRTTDLTVAEDLHWWLTEREDWLRISPAESIKSDTSPRPALVSCRLRTKDPLHVGATKERDLDGSVTRGQAPARTWKAGGQMGVPASSLKGIFRHRTTVIGRLVGLEDAEVARLRTFLFGDSEKGRGVLRFHDMMAPRETHPVCFDHVAIDRFTGGSREGALFSVEAIPENVELCLRIDLDRTLSEAHRAAVASLLCHVLQDLHDGLIGLGGKTWRGYGTVRVMDGLAPPRPLDTDQLRQLILIEEVR